ncbi:carboxypeptidase regulatory-like domain-containing protein [bacterium]|nr:carboxypeptidase regulatory-like domain-containing protein [bacterium]
MGRLIPAELEQAAADSGIFPSALPMEGSFHPSRVTAASSLSLDGALYSEASGNVSISGSSAQFSPAGGIEYALWRFHASTGDSLGSLEVDFSGAQAGAECWIAVADYGSGRWDWRGSSLEAAPFTDTLSGAPGQHSSPAGYIYVAALCTGTAGVRLDEVRLGLLNRHSISGVVQDLNGQPLAGVLLTTDLLDPQTVLSGPDGSFTLGGFPDGNWSVMPALAGWQFWPALTEVSVSGADVSGLILQGSPGLSGMPEDDQFEPDNQFANAREIGSGPLTGGRLGILDDPVDNIAFDIDDMGWYYIQFTGEQSILFPRLRLRTDAQGQFLVSDSVVSGANWVGFYFPRQGKYAVEVSCEGGAGSYGLEILPGQVQALSLVLSDSGTAGDGDDSLVEELQSCHVLYEAGGLQSVLTTQDSILLQHDFMPPLAAQLTPQDAYFSFQPASVSHDFGSGPLELNFTITPGSGTDVPEPNDDRPTATVLNLPLAETVQGLVGGGTMPGQDEVDYFRVTLATPAHLQVRVRFPGHEIADMSDVAYLNLEDQAGASQDCFLLFTERLELRSNDPLPAGDYYIQLYGSGNRLHYELDVRTFAAVSLEAHYLLDGNPLQAPMLRVATGEGTYVGEYNGGPDGIANCLLPLIPGEQLLVQHACYGLSIEPALELVSVGTADIVLSPAVSYDGDSLEPNDSEATAAPVSLGTGIMASIDQPTDGTDYYSVALASSSTLIMTLLAGDPDVVYELTMHLQEDPLQRAAYMIQGLRSVYFRTSGAGTLIVRVHSGEGSDDYILNIDNSPQPVFLISGSADDDAPGETESHTYIVNHTTGDSVEPEGGSYRLGFYPDGDYEIQWQISNRDIIPPGKTTLTIAGADQTLNYTSTYSDKDSLEPNNNQLSAAPLSVPSTTIANLDFDNDQSVVGYDWIDYYSVTAASDGILELQVSPQENSPVGFVLLMLQEGSQNHTNLGKLNPQDGSRLLRQPVTAGATYWFLIQALDDMRYQMDVSYLP